MKQLYFFDEIIIIIILIAYAVAIRVFDLINNKNKSPIKCLNFLMESLVKKHSKK